MTTSHSYCCCRCLRIQSQTGGKRLEKRHLCYTLELLEEQKIMYFLLSEHRLHFSTKMSSYLCPDFACYHMSTPFLLDADAFKSIYLSCLEKINRPIQSQGISFPLLLVSLHFKSLKTKGVECFCFFK